MICDKARWTLMKAVVNDKSLTLTLETDPHNERLKDVPDFGTAQKAEGNFNRIGAIRLIRDGKAHGDPIAFGRQDIKLQMDAGNADHAEKLKEKAPAMTLRVKFGKPDAGDVARITAAVACGSMAELTLSVDQGAFNASDDGSDESGETEAEEDPFDTPGGGVAAFDVKPGGKRKRKTAS